MVSLERAGWQPAAPGISGNIVPAVPGVQRPVALAQPAAGPCGLIRRQETPPPLPAATGQPHQRLRPTAIMPGDRSIPTAVAPPLGKPGRDVPRSAAEIRDWRVLLRLLDEAVEWLAGGFIADAGRILLSDSVAAAADGVVAPGSFHGEQRCTAGWILGGHVDASAMCGSRILLLTCSESAPSCPVLG
jgi:hypothetical protein